MQLVVLYLWSVVESPAIAQRCVIYQIFAFSKPFEKGPYQNLHRSFSLGVIEQNGSARVFQRLSWI